MGFSFYFGGFKCFDCYYLIVCCSLGPVLVIWCVISVFLQIQWHFSKLKKKEIWYSKFGSSKFEITAVSGQFYHNLC